jgi:hypothetical protein
VVEERLREQEAEGVIMPDMPRDELALRKFLIAGDIASRVASAFKDAHDTEPSEG